MYNKNLFIGLLTALCVGGFIVIAFFVTQGTALAFDIVIQEAVFSMRSHWLTLFLVSITYSGNWQMVTLICAGLLLLPQTRQHYGLPMTASALLSVSLYQVLKFIFQRPRPDVALQLIDESGFSFPSGHTLASLVFWGMAILLIRTYAAVPYSPYEEEYDFPHFTKKSVVNLITIILAVYIFLIAFSRIYVGVHYPTDIIAGWCLGICLLTGLYSSYMPALLPRGRL